MSKSTPQFIDTIGNKVNSVPQVLDPPNVNDRVMFKPVLNTKGNVNIPLPGKNVMTIEPDGTVRMYKRGSELPIMSFESIKTGALHADQVLTVGDQDGWRVELAGVTSLYPIRYWNGATSKFSLDTLGNLLISGIISASEIHIPSILAGVNSFHADSFGNVWWNSITLAAATCYIKKNATVRFSNIILDTSVTINDGVLTGGIIQTAISGQRIVISSNLLKSYDSGGILRMRLDEELFRFYDIYGSLSGYINGNVAGSSSILALTAPNTHNASIYLYGGTVTPYIFFEGHMLPRANDIWSLGYLNLNWKYLYLSDDTSNGGIIFGDILRLYMSDVNSVRIDGNLHVGTGSIDIKNINAGISWNGVPYLTATSMKLIVSKYLLLHNSNADLSPGSAGLIYFNTVTSRFRGFDGSIWRDLCFYDERNA